MLSEGDWLALGVSIQLALLTTVILMVLCTPLAWWLARRRLPGQALLEAMLALPLVLPPSVLGVYLYRAGDRLCAVFATLRSATVEKCVLRH